jgi:hypothetical protein
MRLEPLSESHIAPAEKDGPLVRLD